MALGLKGTSSGSRRSVQNHADRIGADYSHFTRGRKWTEDDLKEAVADSRSWNEVAGKLGLAGGSAGPALRGHALRLGLDTAHFGVRLVPTVDPLASAEPTLDNLRTAAGFFAAAWFTLSGYQVSWPLEPCRYDLLALRGDEVRRVQVKTTTWRHVSSWSVNVTTSGRIKTPYDPTEVDDFFIIDGELNYYLIPISVIGGMTALQLNAYQRYRLPQLQPLAEAA